MEQQAERIGILIANTGSPDAPSQDAAREFLKQYLSNKRIAPKRNPFFWIQTRASIIPKRSETLAQQYRKIWMDEGSPMLVHTERLANALAAKYREEDLPYTVKFAMSFGSPSISDALEAFYEEGINRLVVLPLYPVSAFSTVKVVEDEVRAKFKAMSWRPYIRYINGYADHPVFARTIAASIKHAGFAPGSTDKLVYVFPSIPLSDIEAGDAYELSAGAACLAISNELLVERRQWTIAYGGVRYKEGEWLAPSLSTVLERESGLEAHRVFIACPNHPTDCLETLYEISAKAIPSYRSQLIMNGMQPATDCVTLVECLNDSDAHVRLLGEVVRRATL